MSSTAPVARVEHRASTQAKAAREHELEHPQTAHPVRLQRRDACTQKLKHATHRELQSAPERPCSAAQALAAPSWSGSPALRRAQVPARPGPRRSEPAAVPTTFAARASAPARQRAQQPHPLAPRTVVHSSQIVHCRPPQPRGEGDLSFRAGR